MRPMPDPIFCPWIHHAGDHLRPHRWMGMQRRITHWILVTSLDGSEQITVDGQDLTIPSGSSYLLPPGSISRLGSRDGNRPLWIHFDASYHPHREQHPQIHGYAPELGPRRAWLQPTPMELFGVHLPILIPKPLSAWVRSIMPDIIAHAQQGPLGMLHANMQVGTVLLALVRHVAGPETVSDDLRLHRAEQAALAGIAAGSGTDAMASAAGLSRSRFFALWKRHRRDTPAGFLRHQRIEQAQHLLRSTTSRIEEIALRVGYRDATVFGRAFRAATGTTPRTWRARHA
jgi:AraC-like DNA-binding protein